MRLLKPIIQIIALFVLSLETYAINKPNNSDRTGYYASIQKDLPFITGKISEPKIPQRSVNLEDFSGKGDGVTLNTEAFSKAIEYLSSKGGGHLIIPEGIWLTGPIEIKSNIDLHITKDALVIFSSDRDLYPLVQTSFEGLGTWRCESPIHAEGAHDISITGGGVIDGNGQDWRPVKKSKLTSSEWKKLKGGWIDTKKNVWYPSEAYYKAEQLSDMNVPPSDMTKEELEGMKDFLRPVMVSLRNCTNVLLEDCTFQNSPAWNIHPLLCRSLIVDNITVRNPYYAQNGDGIDIESCTDVFLTRSSFDVGDDGICVKSGKDEDGRKRGVPTRNLVVDGCTVYHGHGGFVVGSEMSGGVENVKVSSCRFLGTDVGLRFKSKRGRGGVVKNIWIDNIHMTNIVTDAILFDLFYNGKSAVESLEDGSAPKPEIHKVDETTPEFRDIHISNIVCNGAGRAMYFNGLEEMPVSNIEVHDCTISAKKGMEFNFVRNVTLNKVEVRTEDSEPVLKGNALEEVRTSSIEKAAPLRSDATNKLAEIVVAQDGSGDFTTIQEAIDACPDYDHGHFTTIYVKAGVYKEMVTIPHNKFRLTIKGEGADRTIITYDKYARRLWPGTDRTMGTSGSATMYIHSSYVTLEDLTVENSSGEGKEIGQAVALFTDGDFLFFHRCRFIGNQDTIYTYGRYGKDGGIKRNYFLDCYIEGTTDFIFGPSVAYFENCRIHSKKNSYVTAASTFKGEKYGYVFHNCTLTADPGITKCYLGRPWGAYAKTVFIDCELGSHILPEGWHNWEKEGKPNTEKNSYYAEYKCHGPGAYGKKDRVKWSYQLTDKEAEEYSFEKVMYQENDGIVWDPMEHATPQRLSVRMAKSEIQRNPDASYIDGLKGQLKFNYTTGLELKSFLDVYAAYGDPRLLSYVNAWYDAIVNPDGTITSYKLSNYTVDRVSPANTLLELYSIKPEEKYRKALELVRSQYETHPRTTEGCFWHKKIYPHQIWLDGLYMAQPFYAGYTAAFASPEERAEFYEDICNCFIVAARHTYDPETGLYRHAWDESRSMFWCNKDSGQSDHCWGRALGWYAMALTDVLEILPSEAKGRDSLVTILGGICKTLPSYADPETGMWWQVLDRPGKEGNYVESTCSAMFIYTFLKASRLGLIAPEWKEYGKKAYEGFVRRFIRRDDNGTITLTDCCAVAGLGGKDNRRGDYEYYINEKVCENDPKGIGPFIMASLEYERQ